MKNLRTIMTVVFLMLFFIGYSQETTIKYSYQFTNWLGKKSGASKEVTFDAEYGIYPLRAMPPAYLAIETGDEPLVKWGLLKELRKPIWGPNNNQKFQDILPTYIEPVPEFINVTVTPWQVYDPWYPPTADIYAPFGFELRKPMPSGNYMIFQGSDLDDALYLLESGTCEEWRPYNPTQRDVLKVPNPDYPGNVAAREQMYAEYYRIITQTFVQTAEYYFPTLYYPNKFDALQWYIKEGVGDWVSIEPSMSHELASNKVNDYKKIRKVVRFQDEQSWDSIIAHSIGYSGDKLVKKICGY